MSSIPFDITPDALRAESAALRGLSRALLGHEQDAEDAEQETWLAALQHPPARTDRRSAWLSRVARNFALGMRRKDAARRRREQQAARPESLPSTLEAVERVALHQQIVEAVLALHEPYRTTLVLRFWEDLPFCDVARQMGVPVSTVRTRVCRALANLRQRLDDSCGDRKAWSGLLSLGLENAPAAGATTVTVSAPAASLALAGALLMTTKAKLATVAVVCGVVLATLWALQGPAGEGGLPHHPAGDPGGGKLVAEGEGGAGMKDASADKQPPERTEVPPQPEARPEAQPKLGSLLLRAIWADDKKPAAGVMLKTMYVPRVVSSPFAPTGFTDQDGTLRIDNLQPGQVLVHCYRGGFDGGKNAAQIRAGEEARLQIVVPIGIHAHGIVVDQGGNPVADADLIVASRFGWADGAAAAIAKSGADGRFRLRSLDLPWGPHLGARARGHAPSPLYPIPGKEGDDVEVRIVLGGRGGAVHGRVLNPKGLPVPQAMVQVGKTARPIRTKLPDGSYQLAPMPVRTRTDDEGHFAARGLLPGKTKVAVWAKGLAPWYGSVEIPADGDPELLVHLLPAVTIRGTVRDGDGRPLARVAVHARPEQSRVFGLRGAQTDADGNYRLDDLGPGRWKLTAKARTGNAEALFRVVAGQNMRWDPLIFKSLMLRGRVVDEQDRPVRANISAGLRDPEPGLKWGEYAFANKKGEFEVKNCIPGKEVWMRVSARSFRDQVLFVQPDQQNLVIRMRPMDKPSVHVSGQLLDPDGKPAKTIAKVRVMRKGSRHATPHLFTQAGTGRFKSGPHVPGVYRVFVDAKGYPRLRTSWTKLIENQTWDLGALQLQRGGNLNLELEDPEGVVGSTSFRIRDMAGIPWTSIRIHKGVPQRSEPIPPGRYYVQVVGKNCLCARHEFEIHAGRDTQLKIQVARGTPVSLEFVVRTDEGIVEPSGSIMVEIQSAAGQVILTREAWWLDIYKLVRVLDFAARPGKYRLVATTETGERGEAELTVGDKPAGTKRIVLR